MIVFHGSPNYFGKFNNDKIGTARAYNPVQGHYFADNINTALQYQRKYQIDNKFSLAFLQDVTQNISGYLYVCEVPDKTELLDLSQEIADAPESVQTAIYNIRRDRVFEARYIKTRRNNSIGEFVTSYDMYCHREKIYSMLPNIFQGYKGVYWKQPGVFQDVIVIFDAKDIQIKQCFSITQIQGNNTVNPEYHTCNIVTVLFKRFGKYYYASGTCHQANGVLIFVTSEDCPEILDEVQTFDELEQNPFVIAYIVNKPLCSFSVSEVNVNSLNYNPRSKTRPKKANIYTVGDIQAILNYSIDAYTPVKSKIVNITEFAEYKRQADSYKYMRQFNPFILNAVADNTKIEKANTLFLQRADKPYFNLHHTTPAKALEFMQATQVLRQDTAPVREKQERKLTDEQVQERTKEFLKVLKPIIKERIKTLYNLPDETEKQ